MDHLRLSHTLADAFNALADEVQILADRKTVLEHKLRFAHEQFQYLADKYAPSTPEIAETLAKLQLPPHTSVDDTSPVPLPQRSSPQSQHHIALVIRDGRRAATQLVSLAEPSKTTGSSRESLSHTSHLQTSMSTALEQDFTIEGKKGNLQCPFSRQSAADDDGPASQLGEHDQSVPHSADPICAAMYDESASQPPPSGTAASKCPIRFMDKHSAEEIAHYVETHKHELPRSHEVCLRRYQKNEEQIKKLDSKYGNIVSMIEGLGQIHQSMLPEEEEELPHRSDVDRASNERVENWAQAVSGTAESDADNKAGLADGERQAHFDRPLKEVRVGESPSRPWGISVPIYEVSGPEQQHPPSPPPAPVRMPSPTRSTQAPVTGGKCPFDHTKLAALNGLGLHPKGETRASPTPQPAFVNPSSFKTGQGGAPQMIFTGPVFIGYPMEQAIQFLNQDRGNS
ncbi:hypothetical protein HRG_005671 [Hirsutella rhossiliensis]|uniref:Uncharacterized protein n=1 Tax=Hirsutella rhossiliensis TaxID=111463 RepID=A0A9P8MZK8_9HYPO|nr:uncharacterized protein HRG_05671 [Hirsutella rhossiliensis]KAH0963161.1 hypothetical protein HRG_05671 [Hirsutella rhossiliensis]